MKIQPIHEDRRRGVALIIVLGFLSIMVMMAVAFLTQARVERMVSNASLEGMRTRQFAQTAIASAMQDYLNALKSVDQTDPQHDIFLSGDYPGNINFYYSGNTVGDDRMVIGKVEDWLKTKHLDAAMGGGEATDDIQNAEWIWVRENPRSRSQILGRYAYAIFDMSGLLDANLLGADYGDDIPTYGSVSNRNNVRRMLFDALDESSGGAKQQTLNFYREVWRGFDTPAALLNLTDGDWNDGRNSGPNRWIGSDMEEGDPLGDISALSPYSYSLLHLGSSGGQNLKVPCDAANIEASGGGELAAVVSGTSPAKVYQALRDYESPPGAAPEGIDYPSVKNVPMFNEIGIQVQLLNTGNTPANPVSGAPASSTYDMAVLLQTEFWYPFPSEQHHTGLPTFTFQPSVGGGSAISGTMPSGIEANIWVQIMGRDTVSGAMIPLNAVGVVAPVATTINPSIPTAANCGAPFTVPIITIPVSLTDAASGSVQLPQNMDLLIAHIQVSFLEPMKVTQGGVDVDSTPSDNVIEYLFMPFIPLAAGATTPAQGTWEVQDPRLNHLRNRWDQNLSGVLNTWNGTNNAALGARAAAAAAIGFEPGQYFYCRNGPMESPAELGYIPTDDPWETLNVFSDDGVRLMNRLICDPDVYEMLTDYDVFFTNGTLNPYTRDTNVLVAAFYGLDVREVPGMAGGPSGSEQLNGSELDGLVEQIMIEDEKDGYAGWSRVLADEHIVPDMNMNNRISTLRNTWGLFNESDRIFVVVVIAQSIKESEGESGEGNWDPDKDVISGERRAVALCWLDASAEGSADELTQEMNILMFQYLNE